VYVVLDEKAENIEEIFILAIGSFGKSRLYSAELF